MAAVERALNKPKSLGVAKLRTYRSWLVLGYLATRPEGEASHKDIREKLALTPNTMGRSVKELKSVGYIVQGFDFRGGHLLRIEPRGRDAFGAVHSHASDLLA